MHSLKQTPNVYKWYVHEYSLHFCTKKSMEFLTLAFLVLRTLRNNPNILPKDLECDIFHGNTSWNSHTATQEAPSTCDSTQIRWAELVAWPLHYYASCQGPHFFQWENFWQDTSSRLPGVTVVPVSSCIVVSGPREPCWYMRTIEVHNRKFIGSLTPIMCIALYGGGGLTLKRLGNFFQ